MLRVTQNTAILIREPIRKNAVKLTALLYLKEALVREQYEKCAELVETAKEFGAQPFEIQDLLEDPRRTPS